MIHSKLALISTIALLVAACGLAGPPTASLVLPTPPPTPTAPPTTPLALPFTPSAQPSLGSAQPPLGTPATRPTAPPTATAVPTSTPASGLTATPTPSAQPPFGTPKVAEPSQDALPSATVPTPAAVLPTARPSRTPTAAPADRVALRLVAELATGGNNLAFSPDGSSLAVGTFTGEVQVWDTATWTQRWKGAHTEDVRKIAFSPEGSRLASASFDGTARLWDVASGAQVARLDYARWVYGLDFTSDGRQWASGSFDGRLILADTATGKIVREFKQDLLVYDLALSPGGPPWLAAATTGSWGPGRVVVWDTVTGENRLLAEFQVPGYSSNVAFSPDNRWLAAGLGNTAQVVVWQTLIWPEVTRLTTPAGIVNHVLFSPEGGRLAAVVTNGEQDNSLVVWDVPGWQVVSTMKPPDQVWSAAFSPNGQWLVVGLGQGVEHLPALEGELWDVNGGTLAARMPHAGQVLAVAFSRDGRRIATASNDAVKVWEMP